MTNSITITMPLPPKELWQNRPCNWRKKYKVVRNYRLNSYAGCRVNRCCPDNPWEKASARYVFYWKDKRRRDIMNANAAMKPAMDGIVDAGIIVDDDYKHLTHETTEFKFDKDNPRVEITVSEVAERKQNDLA